MMSEAMNCSNARRQLSGLIDGDAASPALESHLATCAACSRDLAREHRLAMALKALPERRPGAAFDAAVLAALAPRPAILTARARNAAIAAAAAWTAASFWAAARLLESAPGMTALAARGGVLLGRVWADAHALVRLAALFIPAPSPRAGTDLLAAAVLAAALFLTVSLPSSSPRRALGVRS